MVDSKKEIHNRETGTFIKVLSAEAYSKHGLNPTVVIFDELHALQKRDLWDVMTFGSGAARKEQLVWIITTAGDDPDRKSIGWEKHEYATKVLNGEIDDPTWFVRIYAAPESADIFDEKVWRACNPSIGVTIDIENVRKEALAAKNSESAERLFRWLRLNQWVALKRVGWLPITLWDRTEADWTREALKGRRCYVGLDLSSVNDLTATAALFPPEADGEPWRFFIDAWIPEESMPEREAREKRICQGDAGRERGLRMHRRAPGQADARLCGGVHLRGQVAHRISGRADGRGRGGEQDHHHPAIHRGDVAGDERAGQDVSRRRDRT